MVHSSLVWVFDKKSHEWKKGSIVSKKGVSNKVILKNGTSLTGRTFPVKHYGRRVSSSPTEKIPSKRTGPRPGRFRVPHLKVDTVYFRRPNEHGDYGWQLEQSAYDSSLHVYNENLEQQRDKSNNFRAVATRVLARTDLLASRLGFQLAVACRTAAFLLSISKSTYGVRLPRT